MKQILFIVSVLQYLTDYFDTNTGGKRESSSYTKIADHINVDPKQILFLTDIKEGKLSLAILCSSLPIMKIHRCQLKCQVESDTEKMSKIGQTMLQCKKIIMLNNLGWRCTRKHWFYQVGAQNNYSLYVKGCLYYWAYINQQKAIVTAQPIKLGWKVVAVLTQRAQV